MIILFSGGQEAAKRALQEAVILPVLRPEVIMNNIVIQINNHLFFL